jgi:PASTA domain
MANTDDIVRDGLINSLRQLKNERLAALSSTVDIQVAMQALFQREARRLEKKLGAQHPRVRQMKSRLKSNLQTINSLEIERQLSRIEAPKVEGEAALIHGRVVDEDGRGIAGLTVCLVDHCGSMVRGASEPVTDASGYFAFVLEPETVDKLNETYRTGIFLGVFTNRRRLMYRHPNPLTLARSARLLVEIPLKRLELISEPSPIPTTVIVPNLVGMTEKEALASLQEVGMQLGQRGTKVAPEQDGRVLEQSPSAGSEALPGSSVSLVIAIPRDLTRRPQTSTRKKR